MKHTLLHIALLLPAALLAGCGGHYILAAGDQLASADAKLDVVARIQHNEIRSVDTAVADQALSVRLYPFGAAKAATQDDGEVPSRSREFGAISNTDGYAALNLPLDEKPVYNKPGKYDLKLSLQTRYGDQQFAVVPVYVVTKTQPIVGVDLEALPPESFFGKTSPAAAALQQIAQHATIVYYGAHTSATRQRIHAELLSGGYPDGPVLLWQPKSWEITREKRFNIPNMPTVSFRQSLVSNLGAMTRQFPGFKTALTSRHIAAQAFASAGLDVVAITPSPFRGDVTNTPDWPSAAVEVLRHLGAPANTAPAAPQSLRTITPGAPSLPAPATPAIPTAPSEPAAPAAKIESAAPATQTPTAPIRMSDLKPGKN